MPRYLFNPSFYNNYRYLQEASSKELKKNLISKINDGENYQKTNIVSHFVAPLCIPTVNCSIA